MSITLRELLKKNLFNPKDDERLADLSKRFEIRESLISNAGLGVFAAIDTPKQVTIAWYRGELLSKAEFQDRYETSSPQYVFMLHQNTFVDAVQTKMFPETFGFAPFINSSRGSLKKRPNVRFTKTGKIVTIQNIKAGEELYISYGRLFCIP